MFHLHLTTQTDILARPFPLLCVRTRILRFTIETRVFLFVLDAGAQYSALARTPSKSTLGYFGLPLLPDDARKRNEIESPVAGLT